MMAHSALPRHILIVDDSPEDRELYRRLLQQHRECEYRVLEAGSGEEGLALCRVDPPDCVLLDYRLPDLDGLEFLTALAGEDGVSIPVIMLTGQGSETIVVDVMKAGAADYMPKSVVSAKVLQRAISNAVNQFKLRAALEEQRCILGQANQELHRRNKEIQSFYHMLSHELKTPLTAIREFVSIVLDGFAGSLSDTQHEYLRIAKDSCDQITLGLNDLLDATRLDTGKLRITPCSTAIGVVVVQAVATMIPTAQSKGVRLRHVIAPDLPDVFIDGRRITQILANLLGNALKFTPEGGEVEVRVNDDPQRQACVRVSVRDTGRGIEPGQLGYIFDRLYQGRSDEMTFEGGLGLGLYICQELARLHGGEISVESTPGKGSTFSFTLPKHGGCETSERVKKEQ